MVAWLTAVTSGVTIGAVLGGRARLKGERPAGRGSGEVFLALRLFAGAALALWTLDVLLNLGFLRDFLLHCQALGSPRDFGGLLLGDLLIAVGVAAAAWLGGAALSLVLRGGRGDRESAVLLCAAMVSLVVLVNPPARYAETSTQVERLIAPAVAGLIAWPVLRLLLAGHRLDSVAAVSEWALVPALVVGFALSALGRALQGRLPGAAVSAVVAAVLLCVCILRLKSRPSARRCWLPWSLVLAAGLLAGLACGSYETCGRWDHAGTVLDRREGRPDIVLIVLDTVRADHLASYGYARDTMPALDEWARGGLIATRAVSAAGWTTPALASLFSGRTVSEHGVHSASSSEAVADDELATRPVEEVSWLPSLLGAEGYYCLAVSANPLAIPSGGVGFDRMVLPRRDRWYGSTFPAHVEKLSPLMRSMDERIGWRMPYVDAAGIVKIVRRALPRDGRPLFLFVNLMDAHSPYNPPAQALKELGVDPPHLFSRYETCGKLSLLWESLPPGRAQCVVDLYDGGLRWEDMHLGPLLEWIGRQLGQDSVIIVTSDHGEELGEQGRVGHYYGLGQSIIHVPLFVRCPGLGVGRLSEPVSTRQIFGFILSCAEGSVPSTEELLGSGPLRLVSERYPSAVDEVTFGPSVARPWVSLIDGRYKVVGPSLWGAELYDVEHGGFDREAAVADSAIRHALAARIDEYWATSQDRRAYPAQRSLTRRSVDALRALGYIH